MSIKSNRSIANSLESNGTHPDSEYIADSEYVASKVINAMGEYII